ncbi:MAG: hypothetical protein ACYDER_01350 [Ktedonobacteraceae bacterium]
MENKQATLIDIIEREMSTDEEDRGEESDYLKAIYEEVSEEGKNAIDRSLAAICGWTLKTLIEKTESCKYLTVDQSQYLFPLTRDEAKESQQWQDGDEIYRIYPDGTEALVENAEDLDLEDAQFAVQK